MNKAGVGADLTQIQENFRDPAPSEEAQQNIVIDLRHALAHVESIVDTVREPMLLLDETLRVRTASRAFYQTFGVSREDTEGQFIYSLGNGQWDIPLLRKLLEEVLPKEQVVSDFEVAHNFPELGQRVMLVNARRLWSDSGDPLKQILLVIEDVTERKRIHDELLRSNEDLQRFAYVAAHDLRSPLSGAMRLLHLFAKSVKDTLGKEDSHMLTESITSMERLSALMRDILSYSLLDHAPQERKLLSLEEPLQVALSNLQHHIAESATEITVGALPTLPADRTQVALLFQNLVGNALKYRGNETPRVSITAARDGSYWRVAVTDNGQGFKSEYARDIFEPFKRLQGAKVPGSGIGLASCKRAVEHLGGRIWAESVPGQGSTFYFTLPSD